MHATKQKATLPAVYEYNGTNYGSDKETTDTTQLVAFDARQRKQHTAKYGPSKAEGFATVVDARWYRGRSRNAQTVWCTVWIRSVRESGECCSGTGSAGGYGYCKRSAAFDAAVRSAGVELAVSTSGVGESAIREAMHAIADAAGYGRCPQVIV